MSEKGEIVILFNPKEKTSFWSSLKKRVRALHEWIEWEEYAYYIISSFVTSLLFVLVTLLAVLGKTSLSTLGALVTILFLTFGFNALHLLGIPFHPGKERIRCFYLCFLEMIAILGFSIYLGHVVTGLVPLVLFLSVWFYYGWKFARKKERWR